MLNNADLGMELSQSATCLQNKGCGREFTSAEAIILPFAGAREKCAKKRVRPFGRDGMLLRNLPDLQMQLQLHSCAVLDTFSDTFQQRQGM